MENWRNNDIVQVYGEQDIWRDNMEIVEVKCKNCGKRSYVLEEYVRNDMFCTLGCMDQYKHQDNNLVKFIKEA